MEIKLYGIPNCDSVKKAIKWLKTNEIGFDFVDFKKKGVEKNHLIKWCRDLGWDVLLNKKGTTWRNLPIETKEMVTDINSAVKLMLIYPTLIKRPVIEATNGLVIGYNELHYQSFFG